MTKLIVFKAFTSTSKNEESAAAFMRGKPGSILFEIRISKTLDQTNKRIFMPLQIREFSVF